MRITRVYTRVGDGGTTRLVGGAKSPKITLASRPTAPSTN